MKKLLLSASIFALVACDSGGSSKRTTILKGGGQSSGSKDSTSSSGESQDSSGSDSGGSSSSGSSSGSGGSSSSSSSGFLTTDPDFMEYISRDEGDPLSYNYCEGKSDHLKGEDKKSFEIVQALPVIVNKKNELVKSGDLRACKEGMVAFIATITDLDLSGKGMVDLHILASFSGLLKINLNSNKVLDIQLGLLQSLKKLKTVFVMANSLTSANTLAQIPTLENIDISNNLIENIDFLVNLPVVKLVDASNNPIKSIAGLLDNISKFQKALALTFTPSDATTTQLASIPEKKLDSCIFESLLSMPPECAGKRLRISLINDADPATKLFFGSSFKTPQSELDETVLPP